MPDNITERSAVNSFVEKLRQEAADAGFALTSAGRVTALTVQPASTPERWWDKANAYAAGWTQKFGAGPSLHAVTLGLSVAEHETWCGDAWPGEHNWGAVQKRVPSIEEKAALQAAGVVASPANVQAARAAIDAAIAQGACPPLDHEALHVDSSPGKGWYFTYFWAFPTDDEGAALFVHTLAEERASCKADLESDTANEQKLATDMYETHYFEGFHDPNQPGGAQANIDDYAGALRKLTPGIGGALVRWTPGAVYSPPAEPDPRTFDVATALGQQQALNFLHVVSPPLDEDGDAGPLTRAAVNAFQGTHQDPATGQALAVDGVAGPRTQAALEAALGIG